MKITLRDLDQSIIEKLNILDNVANTFDETHPDGFVSYGKNGFYFKKTNDTFLKKVYDENELVSLEKALYSTDSNIVNSNNRDLRVNKTLNYATHAFLHNAEFSFKKDFSDKIVLYKNFDNMLLVLTIDGKLYKCTKENTASVDLLKILEGNFNLAKKITANDIVDFEILDYDTLIVATSNFGVYKLNITNLSNSTVELLFVVSGLRKIKLSYTKTLFTISDEFCAQYDLQTGNRIEKYNNILNRRQVPVDIDNVNGNIFILAVSTGMYNLDNLLHCWRLDQEKVSYNNADSYIEKIKLDNRYQVMFLCNDSKNIYIAGLFKDSPFIISYDAETLRITGNKVFKEITLDEFTDIRVLDGNFLILSKNMVYILSKDQLQETVKLPNSCDRIKIFNGEIILSSDKSIVKFQLDKFEKKTETLSYLLFDDQDPCNNIDIFIKGATRTERVILVDGETNTEIIPSYYMMFKNNSIVKLMNSKVKKLILKLSVTPNSNVEGIVVRKNRMFLR